VQILTLEGRTNAYTLLLACFVGAVFAEEIWRSARRFLPGSAHGQPGPAGAAAPGAGR
jgi:hypothetical protein